MCQASKRASGTQKFCLLSALVLEGLQFLSPQRRWGIGFFSECVPALGMVEEFLVNSQSTTIIKPLTVAALVEVLLRKPVA